jgi:hypothetical protein
MPEASLVFAVVPRYIASAWIAQRTPLPTVHLLLRTSVAAIIKQRPLFTEQLPSNGCCIPVYFAVVA